jgi:hypothetical protein
MIHTLNLTFDLEEAHQYHEILKTQYKHLHWVYKRDHNDPEMIDAKNFMDDVHGWGLQTIYADPTFPYHCDLDPHDEGHKYFKDTELVFGFFKKFKDRFENPYRSFLLTFPGGQYVDRWLPTPPPHCKIIMFLTTNPGMRLISHGTVPMSFNPEAGKIYLVETDYDAEFRNNGTTDVTVLTFNVPREYIRKTLTLSGTL